MSRMSVMPAPWYMPRRPSCRTTPIVLTRFSTGSVICICMRIFVISIGFVAVTWHSPASAPLSASNCTGMCPSVVNLSRKKSLTVSLMAFSGATPVRFAPSPLYSPRAPSCRMICRKQSIAFLYTLVPSGPTFWLCMRVFTMSSGNAADVPTMPAMAPTTSFAGSGILMSSFGDGAVTRSGAVSDTGAAAADKCGITLPIGAERRATDIPLPASPARASPPRHIARSGARGSAAALD
mmetsp:Transcript_19919/g.70468  ORF Transcript_19919/g.70468 Transcript_19919/m.70468 type:complete len:237 (-) Transcript_19919:67-777(-)